MTTLGKLTLRKDHILCGMSTKFAITNYLQIIMCMLGQSKVYSEASQMLKELLHIDVSGMQIQRVSTYYGEMINPIIEKNIISCIPKLEDVQKDDDIYVMVDGSMIFTRDEGWKEVKLGRVFNGNKIVPINKDRSELVESVYVSHMGSVDEFFPKLERHLVDYKRKIIIADGAKWIWNWAEDNYPNATHILDFYHAKEKLVLFANHQFKDDVKRKKWVEEQSSKLKEDKVEQVINDLQKTRSSNQKAKEYKEKATKYYLEHEDRMLYKTYMDKGILIGSGAIEAAHRSVLQQRMKLSGQKWTVKGANAIANLRCYRKSRAWNMVENIIKAA